MHSEEDQETLYDIKNDPNCIKNIAEYDKYNSLKDSLKKF